MESLLIFPFNGNGREALDGLGAQFNCIGFVDDTPEKQGMSDTGIPVFGREAFQRFPEARVLAVPGGPSSFKTRMQIIQHLGLSKERWATVIHPAAVVSPRATIGKNVLIMAGAVITSNAKLEDHVCILPNTVVHHDAVIGEGSLVGSSVVIAGQVSIGNNCYIGSGSNIRNNITVGTGALVGLGSNVVKDVEAGAIVAGNPARNLNKPTHP